MASKTRKRKQSLHLSDELIQQPPNTSTRTQVGRRVYNGVVPNQAFNPQHEDFTLQTTAGANGSNQIQRGRNTNIQRGKTKQTQKCNQTNFSLSGEPIRHRPNKSIGTHVDRQVHIGVMDNQQVSNQQVNRHHSQGSQKVSNQEVHHHHSQDNIEVNESIGLMHNHMAVNQGRNSHHQESTQQTINELTSGSNEVEDGQSNEEEMEKKNRGPTYMLEIWGRPSTLPLIKLDFDSYGRPIGANKSKFTEFLGTIARNGKYCPLDVEDWHGMPKECIKEMLNIIKARFDITLANEAWILHSINCKWKSWKSYVKARYFVPNMELDDLIDERDERVLEEQWAHMIAYWNREDVQARSQKNKDARASKNMDHRTGKKSFAQVFDKLANEKGRAPSRSEMFEECYVPTNEAPVVNVTNYLNTMRELRNQLPEGSQDPVGQNDTFAQATGQDKPGYVRMFGGISPQDVWGGVPNRNSYKRMVLEQRAEIIEMKKQMVELQSQPSSQQPQGLRSFSNSLSMPSLTKQTLQVGGFVSLKSLFDPTKIVAKGCLHSTDPNIEVGKQVLGENWCQVHVNVVLQHEEQLIRPYDYCQTLDDALGQMVAWPCHLVTPTESC